MPATERPRRSHQYQLKLIPCNRNFRKYAFYPRTIKDWNALTTDPLPKDIESFFRKGQSPNSDFFFIYNGHSCAAHTLNSIYMPIVLNMLSRVGQKTTFFEKLCSKGFLLCSSLQKALCDFFRFLN